MFEDLNPAPRRLMGPGPVEVDPRVLKAMSMPMLGQFDPQFTGYMNEVMALYRKVFCTENHWTLMVDGTARAGIEAVLTSVLEPGDTVLGMSLAEGGHLTHGASVNFSGRIYNAIQYGLDSETGEIDYEQVAALALEHRPRMIMTGFSAYSRVVDWQRFRE